MVDDVKPIDITEMELTFEIDNSANAVDLEVIAGWETRIKDLEEENVEVTRVNRELMKQITGLLNKLSADPEKEVIKWPNRAASIESFLVNLNQIYKSKTARDEAVTQKK